MGANSTKSEEIDKSKEEENEDIQQETNLDNNIKKTPQKIPQIKSNNKKKKAEKVEVKLDLKSKKKKKIKNGLLILTKENEFNLESSNVKEENEFDFSILDEKKGEINFCKSINEINKFTNLLKKLNLTEYINFPKICSIGNQSNGKTSILTNIIGYDILPKGAGVVTRRPIELRLNHIESDEPYAYFDDQTIITDFSIVKEKINNLTKSVCGENKNIIANPLTINIFSQTCPNLTIIDLPGIVKVPVGDQPKNIEEITKEITLNYIKDPYTIILCALDANQDITTSDGLYLAKQVDYLGERTLGVLTKVDLMDEGTNCKEILENKFVPLKLGYIATKNRSKLDLINNISIKEGLLKEKTFFEENDIYNKMDKRLFGTQSLIEKLVEVYTNMFYKNIGDIIGSIKQHIKRINNELIILGKPLPENISEKNIVLQDLIKNYCNMIFNLLNNRTNISQIPQNDEPIFDEERNKIKKLYDQFLIKYISNNYYIKLKTKISKDISFLDILSPKLKHIENKTVLLFKEIVELIFKLSYKVISQIFERFPNIEGKIMEIVKIILEKEIKSVEELINQILKYEFGYEFTNDEQFLEKYSIKDFLESNDEIQFKNALNDYFKIIVRNIRNIIPKTIQYKLIHNLEKNLLYKINEYIFNNQDIINEFEESEDYIKLRNDLNNSKTKLEKILKKLINSSTISKILLNYDKNKDERVKQLLKIQKEKKDKLYKNSLKKLKEIRNIKNKIFKTEDIKDTLESICIISSIIKENIIEEKEKNPEKFIPIQEAIENTDKQSPLFCLGLLAKNLEDQGIMTVIEKDEGKTEEEKELSITTLDYLANGMLNETKFDLHFDFGEERNEELLLNEFEQNKFKEIIKTKISERFGISKDSLILTNPQRGSFQMSLIQTEKFNRLTLDQLKNDKEFRNDKYLCKLKEVLENNIITACKLTRNMLCSRGNRCEGWGVGEKRGGYPYQPPIGWIGFGLNVLDHYDNGNNDWLDYNGNKNEWAVAYHGVGCSQTETGVANCIHCILAGDKMEGNNKVFLIHGSGQAHKSCKNANKNNSGDDYVGIGSYCSPNPKKIEDYAGKCKGYIMALMLRVKPQRIRFCNCQDKEYWVLNGKSDEMRPYRILLKKA